MRFHAALLALALPVGSLAAQPVVRGIVVADSGGAAVPGAQVEVVGTTRSAVSDSKGRFELREVARGRIQIQARKLGYQPETQNLVVGEADTTVIELRLTSSATALDPVTVSAPAPEAYNPRMVGFSDRRKFNPGKFLGPVELREARGRSIVEVVRGLGADIQIVNCKEFSPCGFPFAHGIRGASSLQTTYCPVQVFLDAIPMPNTPVPFNLASIPNSGELAGIEYYRGSSQVPLTFNRGDSMCGVLVIWTRTNEP